MAKREYENIKKVVLMGLENSGKTSITLSLTGVKNIPSFCKLNPTKDHQIKIYNILETEFSIWDFGGQEQYRKDQLANFNTYIKETDKFIYVIDIQDTTRYEQALNYLIDIISLLKNINKDIDFSIFLHKYDPDLYDTNKSLNEEVINTFISKLKAGIPLDFNYNLFKTSIYTIFQKSKI